MGAYVEGVLVGEHEALFVAWVFEGIDLVEDDKCFVLGGVDLLEHFHSGFEVLLGVGIGYVDDVYQ